MLLYKDNAELTLHFTLSNDTHKQALSVCVYV